MTTVSAPARIAILGLGPSVAEFLNLTRGAGGRRVHYDEVWSINALGDVFQCDRVFHMDDVRIQEIRAAAQPDSNIAEMLKWMKRPDGPPIYTSRTHPDYPRLEAFPLEAVLNSAAQPYMNSTAACAIAYAVHLHAASGGQVKKLACYGMDFTYANAHDAEKGRACAEFWLGIAWSRGIQIALPKATSLMDICVPQAERVYGYDTLDVSIQRPNPAGPVSVTLTERTGPLPTAQQIEERYDHSNHPSPLMEEVIEQPAEIVELAGWLAEQAAAHRQSGRDAEADKCERFQRALQ